MREDRRRNFLSRENPWIGITINSGEIYPTLGARATDALAKAVTESIDKPTKFWFDNFERLSTSYFGLEAYVVTGIDPRSGRPAREERNVKDVFIHRLSTGAADIYISCNKTEGYRGVATCEMNFGMEPKARVDLTVRFARSRLSQWRTIRQSAIDLLSGFEIRD